MRRRINKRLILFLVIFSLIVGVSVFFVFRLGHKETPVVTNETKPTELAQQEPAAKTKLRFIAAGDMLAHDSVNQQAKTDTGYDYKQFFAPLQSVFDSADLRFCNQEVVSAGPDFGISGFPSFNAPTEFARDLSAVGCNVINLANNHTYDKGQPAINATLDVWDSLKPLAVAGANRSIEEQQKVRYFSKEGVNFAFVSYAETSNSRPTTNFGLNMLNEQLVRSQLSEARAKADIVLVGVHWGTEYSPGINATQERWATLFAENGAHVVLGTGPHVLEPVKKLPRGGGGETLVWYSLGNMLSTQLETETLIGGFAVMEIDIATKQLAITGFIPTYMHYEWTPEQKAREDLLSRRNLKLYPLAQAESQLNSSLLGTSVAAQTERVQALLNTHTEVPLLPVN